MSADMATGISIREFARRAGCDDKVVRRKVKTEHIQLLEDGTIDPSYLDVDWRSGAGPHADSADEPDADADTDGLEAAAIKMVSADGDGLWSKADAEKVKENYAARLKQLQYARESGLVVEIDDVVVAVASEYAVVRNKLLDLGSKIAPLVLGLNAAEEIKALIDVRVNEALRELTLDVDGERDFGKVRESIQARFSEAADSLEEGEG